MSETTKHDFDLEKCIELEFIKGSYERLLPLLQRYKKKAEDPNPSYYTDEDRYIALERFHLELARFALDYLAVKKGIPITHPKPVTLEELEDFLQKLLADKSE